MYLLHRKDAQQATEMEQERNLRITSVQSEERTRELAMKNQREFHEQGMGTLKDLLDLHIREYKVTIVDLYEKHEKDSDRLREVENKLQNNYATKPDVKDSVDNLKMHIDSRLDIIVEMIKAQ